MSSPEPHQPSQDQAEETPAEPGGNPPEPPRRDKNNHTPMPFLGIFGIEKHQDPRYLFPRLMIYALTASIILCCSWMATMDPAFAAIASFCTFGSFWFIGLKVNRRWAGLIAVLMALAIYYQIFPPDTPIAPEAVLWILASAYAGGLAAWMTYRKFAEDDLFFIPLGALILLFGLLWALSAGLNFDLMRDSTEKYVDYNIEMLKQDLDMEQLEQIFEADTRTQLMTKLENREILPIVWGLALIWALGCWVLGSVARRWAAPASRPYTPLMLFQVQHKYIFLLILALVLEISRYLWFDGRGPSYVSQPLMAVMAVAFFMQGVGIVLFFSALQHSLGAPGRATLLCVVGLVSLAFMPLGGVILGLADVWFDFRRLAKVREHMENQGLHDTRK